MNDKCFNRRDFIAHSAAAAGLLLSIPSAAQISDPTKLSIVEAGRLIRSGQLSPVDLVQAYLERISHLDQRLNAFITVTDEQALIRARDLEAELRSGNWRGPLHGIPIALKDNIDTSGVRTTAATRSPTPAQLSELLAAKAPKVLPLILWRFSITRPLLLSGPAAPPASPWCGAARRPSSPARTVTRSIRTSMAA